MSIRYVHGLRSLCALWMIIGVLISGCGNPDNNYEPFNRLPDDIHWPAGTRLIAGEELLHKDDPGSLEEIVQFPRPWLPTYLRDSKLVLYTGAKVPLERKLLLNSTTGLKMWNVWHIHKYLIGQRKGNEKCVIDLDNPALVTLYIRDEV